MSFTPPKGWDKETDKLFIHSTGVRIQHMTYRQKEGWYLVPTDLDQPVVEFEPTPEGRQKAFDSFAAGALDTKPKRKKAEATETKKKKKAPAPAREGEEEAEGAERAEGEEGDGDDDEKEEEDEGDDTP